MDTYEVVDESPDAISQLKMRHPHGLLFQECELLQKHKQNANVVLALLHFAAGCGLKMDESRNFQTSRVLKNSVESSTRWSKHPKYSINESESIFSLKKMLYVLIGNDKKILKIILDSSTVQPPRPQAKTRQGSAIMKDSKDTRCFVC